MTVSPDKTTESHNTESSNKEPDNKESSNRKIALIVALLLTIIGGLGYWWYTTLVWEEKEIDLGFSKEALQNNFLAAEIFLRKHGIQATTVKKLSLLDSHRWRNIELGRNDTLVLINANKTLDDARYDSLYEWVENGGTLITSTQNPFIGTHTSEEDLLLSDFGITPAEDEIKRVKDLLDTIADGLEDGETQDDESTSDESADAKSAGEESVNKESANEELTQKTQQDTSPDESTDKDTSNNVKKEKADKPENYYRCSMNEHPTEVYFADESKPLRFDFSHEEAFTYRNSDSANEDSIAEEPDVIASEDDEKSPEDAERNEENINVDNTASTSQKEHLLFFEIGAGSITITSDNFIWSNRRIDCHDHAYALWSLVNPNGRVWFLVNQDAPSLAAIIWAQAKYAVLAGVLALVFWLWTSSTRFGPIFVVPQQGRRSLAEHIYASAMLLWRKQQHPQLLTLLRAEIQERLIQQMLPPENVQQQIEFLTSLTGLTQAEIQYALFTNNLTHPQEFTRAIAHLQIIRKYL